MRPPAHVRERRIAPTAPCLRAGGGTRTLTLFRAPAPKAGMSAVPPRPQASDRTALRSTGLSRACQNPGVLSRDVHYTSSETRADRAGGPRGGRLPGPGLVAVDEVSVDVGHFPESRLRLAVAGVRRILRLRLPQIRPLRGSAAGAPKDPRRQRNTGRTIARTTQARAAATPTTPHSASTTPIWPNLPRRTTTTNRSRTGQPHDHSRSKTSALRCSPTA